MTQQSGPYLAYLLSLIGGIFVLLAGLALMLLGAVLTFFAFGIGAIFGVVGVVWGLLIIFCAFMLRSHPHQHFIWGILIVLFSLLSWVGGLGGFAIGFLLALIGGVMGILWSAPRVQP